MTPIFRFSPPTILLTAGFIALSICACSDPTLSEQNKTGLNTSPTKPSDKIPPKETAPKETAEDPKPLLPEKIAYYRNRYEAETVLDKIVDNRGKGFEELYGVRNMRPILHGIAYRGGANNIYHKTNKRDNKNPLQKSSLENLGKEGFSRAIYLYNKNFTKRQVLNIEGHKLVYERKYYSTPDTIDYVLFIVKQNIESEKAGPIYLHCWNGWHASGMIAAVILMQFCDYTHKQAMDYWSLGTDRKETQGAKFSKIEKRINQFEPYDYLKIPKDIQDEICPIAPWDPSFKVNNSKSE